MDKIFEEILLQVRKVWQRRWWIVPVAWLVALAGWFWVDTLPDRYEASAQVYVNTESVLQPLLRGMTITPDTDQRVRMMTQTLLSRPNLEDVVRETELDLQAETGKSEDQIITDLSNSIRLSGSGRNNVYTIRYSSQNPEKAQDVVQTLVNMFMEGGIGGGRTDLASSQRFIENQLERYKEQLDAKEEELEEFKREHAGLLPGEGGRDYYARLENVEQRLEQARLELREARNRKETYERQLEGADPVLLTEAPGASSGSGTGGQQSATPELDARIDSLQRNLDELRRRYTDEHPDVQSTQRIIAELEEEREQARAEAARERSQQQAGSEPQPSLSVYQQQLSLALAEVEGNVASLSERVEEYERRYEELQEQVDRIPRVESQYASLQRSKQVIESNYEQLLRRREQAEMSGQVQTQTEAVDFRVIEPPRVPSEPSEPNRPLLASAVLVLGLGAGTGFAFVLAQLRSTVTSRQALAELTGRPVLGTVSFVETPRYVRRKRLGVIVFVLAVVALLCVYAGVIASYFLL